MHYETKHTKCIQELSRTDSVTSKNTSFFSKTFKALTRVKIEHFQVPPWTPR